jgi:hypothetical protein
MPGEDFHLSVQYFKHRALVGALARPFKAGKGLADEQCVALATLDSTVANATDFLCHKFVRALKQPFTGGS